jgi:menaquinone-9 beta-reductase
LSNDVLVIGGGPAGLAAAIAARRKGFGVTVVDAAHPPIDKACGEGVLPAGVEVLRRLGVQLSSDNSFPFRGIRFLGGDTSVEATFQAGTGLALRRTRLHEILAVRALELGVRLHWGRRITHASELASYGWIVGADGQNSRVRRAAGLDGEGSESWRFGFRRHYRVSPWTDFVEVHWGSRCQIFVTPVGHDEIGIALLSRDSRFRLDSALREFPELQKRLERADALGPERGAVSVSRRLQRVYRGRTVLIGDASGSVDAITGDGLSLAFHQAIALSEALCAGDMRSYETEHRRLARRPALMAGLLLSLDRSSVVRRAVLRILAFAPPVFAKLLAMHTGFGTIRGRPGIRRSSRD